MSERKRVRIAVQRSGRLSDKSLDLLGRCGFEFEDKKNRLTWTSSNFPVEIMLIRHGDIAEYVLDGVCELGIVGINALEEGILSRSNGSLNGSEARLVERLGFGHCRLAIAMPNGTAFDGPASLDGARIATSYPGLLGRWLEREGLEAKVVTIGGSVELAPSLDIADAVCDLVQTGKTLVSNGLREVQTILESECVVVQTGKPLPAEREATLERILQRIRGVQRASTRRYLMMHAPADVLEDIKALFPGMEEPTIMPLGNRSDRVAVHAVTREDVFWETVERLKQLGASSILVMPIEKIVE